MQLTPEDSMICISHQSYSTRLFLQSKALGRVRLRVPQSGYGLGIFVAIILLLGAQSFISNASHAAPPKRAAKGTKVPTTPVAPTAKTTGGLELPERGKT